MIDAGTYHSLTDLPTVRNNLAALAAALTRAVLDSITQRKCPRSSGRALAERAGAAPLRSGVFPEMTRNEEID